MSEPILHLNLVQFTQQGERNITFIGYENGSVFIRKSYPNEPRHPDEFEGTLASDTVDMLCNFADFLKHSNDWNRVFQPNTAGLRSLADTRELRAKDPDISTKKYKPAKKRKSNEKGSLCGR